MDTIAEYANENSSSIVMKMDGDGFEYNVTLGGLVDGGAVVEMIKQYFQLTSLNGSTCSPDVIPAMKDYYAEINAFIVSGAFLIGGLALIIIVYLYVDTLRYLLATASSSTKTHSTFVISIYPVVAVATYCAIIVPRAQLVAEAAIQVTVMTCLYQLFCLFVAYCGGESELIQKANPNTLNLRVGPCCCWPCCIFLPSIELTKVRVMMLRLLVLQLPIVQGFSYMVMLIMWAEEQTIYQVNNGYLQPLVVTSILFGVWGLIMTLKVTSGFLKDYHLQGKFIVLQLVLVLTKLQGLFARMAIWAGIFKCKYPSTPALYSHMIYNIIILMEMALLGLFARNLYKQSIPDTRPSNHPPYIPQKLGPQDEKSKSEVSIDNNNTSVMKKSESSDFIV